MGKWHVIVIETLLHAVIITTRRLKHTALHIQQSTILKEQHVEATGHKTTRLGK